MDGRRRRGKRERMEVREGDRLWVLTFFVCWWCVYIRGERGGGG